MVMTVSNVQYAVESCALVDACKATLLHSLPMRLTMQKPDQLPKHSPVVKPTICESRLFIDFFLCQKVFIRLFCNPDWISWYWSSSYTTDVVSKCEHLTL
jgi:hypothetical protein